MPLDVKMEILQVLIIASLKWSLFLHSVNCNTLKYKDGKKIELQVNTDCLRFVHLN